MPRAAPQSASRAAPRVRRQLSLLAGTLRACSVSSLLACLECARPEKLAGRLLLHLAAPPMVPPTGPAPAAPANPSPSPSPSPAVAPQPSSPAPAAPGGACPQGWGGNRCALCQDNYACVRAENGGLGSTSATCSADLAFAPNSVAKSYSCELRGSGLLNDLLQPGTLLVQCFTGLQPGQELNGGAAPAPAPAPAAAAPAAPPPAPAAAAPAAAAPPAPALTAPAPAPEAISVPGAINEIIGSIGGGGARRRALLQAGGAQRCEIGFSITNPAVDVRCAATNCTMAAGARGVTCQKTACECPGRPDCGSGERGRERAGPVAGLQPCPRRTAAALPCACSLRPPLHILHLSTAPAPAHAVHAACVDEAAVCC
jgi:hypothetical protein